MVIYVMVFIWPWELSVSRLNSSSAKTLVKHQNEWKPFSALISEASRYHIRFLRYWIYLKGTRVSSSDRQVQHENNCVISDAVYNACISKRILIMRAYVKNTGTLENKTTCITKTEMSLCWLNWRHWLHRSIVVKVTVSKMSWKWRQSRYSGCTLCTRWWHYHFNYFCWIFYCSIEHYGPPLLSIIKYITWSCRVNCRIYMHICIYIYI